MPSFIMLTAITLGVVMLSVVMLSFVMLCHCSSVVELNKAVFYHSPSKFMV